MKFKVGDRVKVINCRLEGDNCCNLGKIFTIKDIKECSSFPYKLEGVDEPFSDSELELVKDFTKADLKDGDKCTLKNGQVIFIDKTSAYSFNDIDEQLRYFNDDAIVVKVERPVKYETVYERKEEILDEAEKRYLAEVIRPFRDKVKDIAKRSYDECEYIIIHLEKENIPFPNFKKGTMYEGMEINKEYTLEELGI